MRRYIRSIISGSFHLVEAANGRHALDYCMSHAVDLVITDVTMPDLNGLELLDALKKEPSTCLVPVILLSAHATTDMRIEGLNQGADDFLGG